MRPRSARRRHPRVWLYCAGAVSSLAISSPTLAASAAAAAVEPAPGSGSVEQRLTPIASLSQTFTSHLQAAGAAGGSDAITDAMVGVIWRSPTGRLTGELDYRLSALVYGRMESKNTLRQNLRAHAETPWADRQGSLAVDASIAQQAISAFAFQQVGGSGLASENTTDTVSIRVQPRWWALLPAGMRLDLNGDLGANEVSSTDVGDSRRLNTGAHLAPQTQGRLGWSADLQGQRLIYKAGRATTTTTAYGTLSYRLDDIDAQVSASAGRQSSDMMTAGQADYAYWNLSAVWRPSPRTSLKGDVGHQAIGRSHALSFEHRTALSSWSFSDTRSLNSSAQSGTTLLGTAFDLFYAMYASREPDPAKRTELVNALLRDRGISSNAPVSGGFLASSATVVESRNLSMGMQWPRASATLVLVQGTSRRAGQMLTALDDLSTSNEIRTRGAALALTQALTPASTLNLTLNAQASRGDTAAQRHDQRSLNFLYASRLSPRLGWSLGLRRSLFVTGTAAYDENALIASVNAEF